MKTHEKITETLKSLKNEAIAKINAILDKMEEKELEPEIIFQEFHESCPIFNFVDDQFSEVIYSVDRGGVMVDDQHDGFKVKFDELTLEQINEVLRIVEENEEEILG